MRRLRVHDQASDGNVELPRDVLLEAGQLDEATFGDFVPVLSWRYAREELSTAAGVPAEYAAE